jgi:hypothetical protein
MNGTLNCPASILRPLTAISLIVAAGLMFVGCGKKAAKAPAPPPVTEEAMAAAPTSPAANPVDPAASPDAQEKARIAQALAMREGKVPPPPAMQLRGGEPATPEVLAAYNQQLTRLIFQRRDAPETLEELVRKWPMPRLPTPPPGKQIVYDARMRVILLYPP